MSHPSTDPRQGDPDVISVAESADVTPHGFGNFRSTTVEDIDDSTDALPEQEISPSAAEGNSFSPRSSFVNNVYSGDIDRNSESGSGNYSTDDNPRGRWPPDVSSMPAYADLPPKWRARAYLFDLMEKEMEESGGRNPWAPDFSSFMNNTDIPSHSPEVTCYKNSMSPSVSTSVSTYAVDTPLVAVPWPGFVTQR